MAPLPAPRPLPLAGRTSLSPSPPPPLPPRPPFTRPQLRAERINRPRLFGGHPRGPGSSFSRSPREWREGVGRRPRDPRTKGHLGRGGKGRGAPGGGRSRAGEAGLRVPRPPDAGRFLPVAPHGAERGENGGHGASSSRGTRARPPGPAAAPSSPRIRGGERPGAPQARRPGPQSTFVLASVPGLSSETPRCRQRASAGRSGGKRGSRLQRPHSAPPTRVEGGASRSGGAERPGTRPSRPAGPRSSRKEPIVRREIHFWGPSESPSFF